MEFRNRIPGVVLNPDDANMFGHRVNWNQFGARGGGVPCYTSLQMDLNAQDVVFQYCLFAISI